jgi:hypothetical protein
MEKNMQLNKTIDEINDFIKNKMNLLLTDLLIQSNEYEETKMQILKLPFIQSIINEKCETNTFKCQQPPVTTQENILLNIEEYLLSNKEEEYITNIHVVNTDIISNNVKNIILKVVEEEETAEVAIKEETTENTKNIDEKDASINEEEQDTGSNGEEASSVKEEEQDTESEEGEEYEVEDSDTGNVETEEEIVVEEETKENTSDGEVEEEVEDSETDDVETEEHVVLEEEPKENTSDREVEEEAEDSETEDVVTEKETKEEIQLVISEKEDNDAEDEEEEVFEIEIDGKTYFTTNEKSGVIYISDENGDPGDEVGNFVNGVPIFE